MRSFEESNLTEAVVARWEACPDPRLKTVLTSLVEHLHAFVREVEPTEAEWFAAIDFLTRTGQKCDDRRQEFILLSDTLGVSMLVDALNHRQAGDATETTVQGPFYVSDAPTFPLGADLSGDAKGEPLFVEGQVLSQGGEPLAGAIVDVWQSDAEGFYDVQRPDADAYLRGRLVADEAGRFWFWSILPQFYPIPTDGPVGVLLARSGRHPFRPAHVHFMIQAPGYERLVTHVFVDGDPYLESDAVFGVKESLVRDFVQRQAGTAPDGTRIERLHRHLEYAFRLAPQSQGTAVH